MNWIKVYTKALICAACLGCVAGVPTDRSADIDARPMLQAMEEDHKAGGIVIIGGLRALSQYAEFAYTLQDSTRHLVLFELVRPEQPGTSPGVFMVDSSSFHVFNSPKYEPLDTLLIWAGVYDDSTQVIDIRTLKFFIMD